MILYCDILSNHVGLSDLLERVAGVKEDFESEWFTRYAIYLVM